MFINHHSLQKPKPSELQTHVQCHNRYLAWSKMLWDWRAVVQRALHKIFVTKHIKFHSKIRRHYHTSLLISVVVPTSSDNTKGNITQKAHTASKRLPENWLSLEYSKMSCLFNHLTKNHSKILVTHTHTKKNTLKHFKSTSLIHWPTYLVLWGLYLKTLLKHQWSPS